MTALASWILGLAMLFASMNSTTYQSWDVLLGGNLPDTQPTTEQIEGMTAKEVLDLFGQSGHFNPEDLDKLNAIGPAGQAEVEGSPNTESKTEAELALEALQNANQPGLVFVLPTTEAEFLPDVVAESTQLPANESVVETEWFSANVPTEVVTIKVNTTGGSTVPEPLTYFFDDEGVLGADKLDEVNANPSAVHTGSAVYHNSPQTQTFTVPIFEGTYADVYAKQFDLIEIGRGLDTPNEEILYRISIPSCGDFCAQGFSVRGLFHEDMVDNNLAMRITGIGTTSYASWTTYAVPYDAAQFFSQDYYWAQIMNSFDFANNGIGPNDSNLFHGTVLDTNDGSMTVQESTPDHEMTILWTNITGHGR